MYKFVLSFQGVNCKLLFKSVRNNLIQHQKFLRLEKFSGVINKLCKIKVK